MGDAGVVDEDVEALELAADGAEEGVDRVGIADVAGMSEDLNFCGGQFPARRGLGRFVSSGQDQIAAFGGEGAGDGESDAASGAGDESDLATETGRRP